ncbi:baculoviral IAP repeat-containing protein 5 [Drosophila guanche]|uniref:Blast:Baculoviral IAP repeat-containing protein 5 n=1 Tax=Drosophila guanche TaxID=7266 RepID=A0A3B0KQM3_DROGU|nr:baculoviral IAP repeat-containing protein 5 [Drosophila guanche]SPP88156.1 blast:Baculoviral IAP repeat-containing protein 5 [Drosophila guanche]
MDATSVTDATGAMDAGKLEMFRQLNLLEQHRVESFKDWPFPEQSSCSISKMAEAGFYWTGTKRENDTATCFVCSKTLDGWESEDDPWKEHLKHAPQCEFVKLGCAEKDLTVTQFLDILGTVVKSSIEKSCKAFKKSFIRDNENRLDEFTHKNK